MATKLTCMSNDNQRAWWKNYSIWNGSTDQITSYVCRYYEFLNFKTLLHSVESNAVLIFGLLGFLGGLFTIATLAQKSFRVPDFFLFRLIGYLEMVQMAVVTFMSVIGFLRCDLSFACTLFWAHIATTVTNVCADAVDLIVLFLCIERTVACILPHFFYLFHSYTCWITVAIGSFTVPLLFSLFQAFELTIVYDKIDNRYIDEPSQFSQTSFYDLLVKINTIRFYVTSLLIATATVCSIVGFSMMANRKRKLIKHTSNQSAQPTQKSDTIPLRGGTNPRRGSPDNVDVARKATAKLQRDLCCLQICLAVPVVINHMLYAMGLNTSYSFLIGKQAFEKNLTFEVANQELDRARSFIYFRLSTNISNVLGHGLHFYLYFLFSDKVRRGFGSLVGNFKRSIWSRAKKTKETQKSIECDTRKTISL